jgi:hypothetical protein
MGDFVQYRTDVIAHLFRHQPARIFIQYRENLRCFGPSSEISNGVAAKIGWSWLNRILRSWRFGTKLYPMPTLNVFS